MPYDWRRIAEDAFDRSGLNKNRIITAGLNHRDRGLAALSSNQVVLCFFVKFLVGDIEKSSLAEVYIPVRPESTEETLAEELARLLKAR